MTKGKNKHNIGENGRLYYGYNVNAEYELTPPADKPFTCKVLICELDEKESAEYYRLEIAGAELATRFTREQIDFMLSRFPCTQTEAGEPHELPLMLSEVETYFGKLSAEMKKANVEENKKLKGTSYFKNVQARAAILDQLRFYRANGNTFAKRVTELEKRFEEIEAEQLKILSDKKVDLKILRKTPTCPICGDVGIIDGEICECARTLSDTIKAYCAALRTSDK